jgi:ribosomal protein S12 methylthiotransferase accessory factor YcaO
LLFSDAQYRRDQAQTIDRTRCRIHTDSNGCAAGNTLEEAIVQGSAAGALRHAAEEALSLAREVSHPSHLDPKRKAGL